MARKLFKPIVLSSAIILAYSSNAFSFNFNMAGMFKAFYQLTGYYGAGGDGAITVDHVNGPPSAPYVINTTNTYLTADAAASATTITVNSATGFAASDEVLVMTMEGTNAGKMEFATVSSTGAGSITLSSGLSNAYTSANKVQIVKVVRYSNVTINSGGFVTANSYNTSTGTGGVLVMKVSGTLTINDNGGSGVNGHISMGGGNVNFGSSRGFPGGTAAAGYGQTGTGTGGSGSNGGSNNTPGMQDRMILGSGAGATSGTGGAGGGIIILKAQNIVLNGDIRSEGSTPTAGVAGGGAGGTIQIYTDSLTTSTSCGSISAAGGSGFGGGTAGGNGRVFVNYKTTLNCKTAAPTATSNYLKFNLK